MGGGGGGNIRGGLKPEEGKRFERSYQHRSIKSKSFQYTLMGGYIPGGAYNPNCFFFVVGYMGL